MVARRKDIEPDVKKRRPPATTPEARENQMIALAVDLAEKQLIAGTASSQVISHYLKLASGRENLEREKLRIEARLLAAKEEQIASSARVEELYTEAIAAMREYNGQAPDMDDDGY